MILKGKTAIVTGSGTGIGRALALAFGRAGAQVLCTARRTDRIEETAALIEQDGGTAMAVAADVTRREDVQRMVETVVGEWGTIDILFNNAGRLQAIAPVHEADPENWWLDVTVNLFGPLLCIREVLPHMLERDQGIIINMDGGRPAGASAYASGKAGLMELTRLLTRELKTLKSRVMVFGANPGFVQTAMTEGIAAAETGRAWLPNVGPRLEAGDGRKPEEIAEATLKLLRIAEPRMSGGSYNPDTDFSTW
ncbi:MAG: SDR family oxidoreductase [Kiritimatiellae bacterium]|nr:SDR family oxidoreductase [Kiritimatiellia bacterium]